MFRQARDKFGAEIVVVGDDERGDLDLATLRREAAHERARVICMSHIPTGPRPAHTRHHGGHAPRQALTH